MTRSRTRRGSRSRLQWRQAGGGGTGELEGGDRERCGEKGRTSYEDGFGHDVGGEELESDEGKKRSEEGK